MKHKYVWALPLVVVLMLLAVPRAEAQQSRVSGTVKDAAGNPVTGVELTFQPQDERGVLATAKTNKKGKFMVGLLRPGSYQVTVQAAGMFLRSVKATAIDSEREITWEVDTEVPQGQPFPLNAGDGEQISIELVLTAAVAVRTAAGTEELLSADDALKALAQKVQAGQCAGAMAEIESVTESNPDKALAHYLAGFCHASLQQPDQALASLDRVLEIEPTFPGALLLKGQILQSMGRADEAEAILRREAEQGGDSSVALDAWIALGVLYRDAGRHSEAIEAFEHVKALAPQRPEPYVELAALFTEAGQNEKAEAIMDEAIQAGAADPGALVNIAIDYYNHNQCDRVIAVVERALALESDDAVRAMAEALFARCRLQRGEREIAVEALRRSLELDPNGTFAEENRRLLEALAN